MADDAPEQVGAMVAVDGLVEGALDEAVSGRGYCGLGQRHAAAAAAAAVLLGAPAVVAVGRARPPPLAQVGAPFRWFVLRLAQRVSLRARQPVLVPAVRLLRGTLLVLVGGGGYEQPPPPPQPPAAEAASRALLLLRPGLRAGLSGLPTAWLRRAQQPGLRVWAPPVPTAAQWDLSQTPLILTADTGTLVEAATPRPRRHARAARTAAGPSSEDRGLGDQGDQDDLGPRWRTTLLHPSSRHCCRQYHLRCPVNPY